MRKQQCWCVGRGELLPCFVIEGAFVSVVWVFWSRLLWVGTSLKAGYRPGSFFSGLLIQFQARLIINKIRMKGVVVLWLSSAFY